MNFRMPGLNMGAGLSHALTQFWGALLGDKYKANKDGEEIVGIVDPLMIWAGWTGADNSTDDAGNSGLSLSAFDTTSRADSARIRLINSSGVAKTIIGCVIRGKPVLRYSGDHGRIHDSLIDYDDIIRNGEKKFEFGNNYVCLRSQLESLADWHWKNLTTKRHIYGVEIPGRCYWYSPGEWYTLTISDVKGAEVLDGVVVECCQVKVESQTGELGRSVIVFREVYPSWVNDINAVSHFLSGGDPAAALNFDRVKIASSTYLRAADYYCDGTADEVQINAAIVYLTGLGGGIPELTEGLFVTAAAIAPADNIGITGHGWNTVIEKNGDYHGIYLVGSGGSEYTNIYLGNFRIKKDAGDTNTVSLIRLEYVDNLTIDHVMADGGRYDCCYLNQCDNPTVFNSSFVNGGANGLQIKNTADNASSAKVFGNYFYNNADAGFVCSNLEHAAIYGNVAEANTDYGFALNAIKFCTVSDNILVDNGDGDLNEGGINLYNTSLDNIFTGNVFEGNNPNGFYIQVGSDGNVFTGNRATANTTANLNDNGTNIDSGNDWT